MFRLLPEDFPALEELVKNVGGFQLGEPPDMRSLGERVLQDFLEDKNSDFANVKASRWKLLPYALWIGGQEALISEPDLLGRFRRERLGTIDSTSKRVSRWVRPMIFCYTDNFRE